MKEEIECHYWMEFLLLNMMSFFTGGMMALTIWGVYFAFKNTKPKKESRAPSTSPLTVLALYENPLLLAQQLRRLPTGTNTPHYASSKGFHEIASTQPAYILSSQVPSGAGVARIGASSSPFAMPPLQERMAPSHLANPSSSGLSKGGSRGVQVQVSCSRSLSHLQTNGPQQVTVLPQKRPSIHGNVQHVRASPRGPVSEHETYNKLHYLYVSQHMETPLPDANLQTSKEITNISTVQKTHLELKQ